MVHGYAKALASAGFVALAAEYLFSPEAPWPSQLDDVRDVVRWAKANAATLDIDSSKLALQGYSAGAHLALLVGGTQPGVLETSGRWGRTPLAQTLRPSSLSSLPPNWTTIPTPGPALRSACF